MNVAIKWEQSFLFVSFKIVDLLCRILCIPHRSERIVVVIESRNKVNGFAYTPHGLTLSVKLPHPRSERKNQNFAPFRHPGFFWVATPHAEKATVIESGAARYSLPSIDAEPKPHTILS